MNDLPWHPDRTLTAQDAREAIATCFPHVDSGSAKHLATGWEFDVYLTSDGWVFRFPRRDWIAGLFEPERRAHELVSTVLPPNIAVPKVELMGRPTASFPYVFAGHRFINGVPADVSAPVESTLARDIAAALEAIHSIPIDEVRAAGINELDIEEQGRKDWLRSGVELASQLRGWEPSIDPGLDWLAGMPLTSIRYEGPLSFIHTAMSAGNLLVDRQTGRLTGILDWTDTMLGDAARDFAELVMWRGWAFTEEVMSSYHLPVDEDFRNRISFSARLVSTVALTAAHAHGMDTAAYVNGVRNSFAA